MNNMIKKVFATLFVACVSLLPVSAQRTLLYDNDGSELLLNSYWNYQPLEVWQLDSLTRMLKDSQVSTYAICGGSDFFYYPTKFGRIFGDDRNGTISHGNNKGLYRILGTCFKNIQRLDSAGAELVETTLQMAGRYQLDRMLTYRMNDLHFADKEIDCPVAYSDWWLAHPEYHIGDPNLGWHSAGAYDFAHKAVRDRKYKIISEQLHHYRDNIDIYLIDYMRFFCYFQRGEGPKHTEEMTELLRKIRRVANKEARNRKQGGKIRLAVRVAPSVAENLEKGIDIRQWLREGLVDLISVGTHTVIDPAQPIARLRSELGDLLNVPLYASNDCVTYTETEPVSEGMMRGFCSAALAQGADGIYLFNYFFSDYNAGKLTLEDGGQVCRKPHPRMLKELGSLQTLAGRNKIYWLSDGKRQYGLRPNTPLPLSFKNNTCHDVSIFVGDNVEQQRPGEVMLFFRTRGSASVDILLNGKPMLDRKPEYVKMYDKERRLGADDHQYAVTLPAAALCHGDNVITFRSKAGGDNFTLRRVELALKYGDVEHCGYF